VKKISKFVNELNNWWPPEYTWSQEQLQEIRIDGRKDGLCTEIGPHGFRCDWGRVTELTEGKSIAFKWQISPKREPIPNPDKASDIRVEFVSENDLTRMTFEHFNFDKHGEGADEYRQMLDTEYGWTYILDRYQKYCE